MIYRNSNPLATNVVFYTQEHVQSDAKLALFESLKFTGKFAETAFFAESNTIFVGIDAPDGVKNADPFTFHNYYELGAVVISSLEKTKLTTFTIAQFPATSEDLEKFLLGMMQAAWRFDKYVDAKKSKRKDISLHLSDQVSALLSQEQEKLIQSLHTGLVLMRGLIDDGPEAVNPESMVQIIQSELGGFDSIRITTLPYEKLLELGMEGITFVGRASRYKPVLSHVVLNPKGEVKRRVCLVGKGLTYDSGGYSIKTGGHMLTMKMDMAGSSTMFGVIKALAENGGLQHTEVHWITAFAENLIDGAAYKPDDVMTTYAGLTIEILNTDAEGRLTLADALAYATLQNPDYIIDAATLTGAAVMATSEYRTALMGNDQELIDSLYTVLSQEHEQTTVCPLPEPLRETLESEVADLANISNQKYGGHLTAGLFLSYFVDQTTFRTKEKLGITNPKAYAWAHFDIAGTAMNNKKNNLNINGATGQNVRSLVKWFLKNDG